MLRIRLVIDKVIMQQPVFGNFQACICFYGFDEKKQRWMLYDKRTDCLQVAFNRECYHYIMEFEVEGCSRKGKTVRATGKFVSIVEKITLDKSA